MELGTERPNALKVDHRILKSMSDDDVQWLLAWSRIKAKDFTAFCHWFAWVLENELAARSDELIEREMISIPRLNGQELCDFYQAVYVLERLPLTDDQHKLIDKLSLLVMGDISAALVQFNIGTLIT